MIYVFDVDGTLTPAREKMDPEFKLRFKEFFRSQEYALVSGSDYNKLLFQVGVDILSDAKYVFACAGNSVWQKGVEIHKSDWVPSKLLIDRLNFILDNSKYADRFGNHIEHRPGMINFSVVGRMALPIERKNYYDWDKIHNEREDICNELLKEFPELEFEVGGEISIDIYPLGNNKSQVLNYIKDTIYFFGDGIMPGKNDWRLAEVLTYPSRSFPVSNWNDTLKKLTQLKDNSYK